MIYDNVTLKDYETALDLFSKRGEVECIAFSEGVLNDMVGYALPDGVNIEGERYDYMIFGYRYQNSMSNTLYIEFTNDESKIWAIEEEGEE